MLLLLLLLVPEGTALPPLGAGIPSPVAAAPVDRSAVVEARPGPRAVPPGPAVLAGSNLSPGSAEWQPSPVPIAFPGANYPATAYDPSLSAVIEFGPGASTWEYRNYTWTVLDLAVQPPARSGASMVWDAADGYLLLFGGSGAAGPLNDTWIFSGMAWTPIVSNDTPAARTGGSMAYDPVAGAVVLVGGTDCVGNCSGWWEYRAGQWLPGPGPGPPLVYGAALAYDPVRGEMVRVGGVFGNGSYLAGAWVLEGTASNLSWNALPGIPEPSPRLDPALALDPPTGTLVLFGGEYLTPSSGISSDLNDTWELGRNGWSNVTPRSSPPARGAAGLVYDAAQGALLLFGGCGPEECPFADLWSFGPAEPATVETEPTACGSVEIGGAPYGDGQVAYLVNGSYPIGVAACPGWGLQSLSTDGGLRYAPSSGDLLVAGAGQIRILFQPVRVALSVFLVPPACGVVEVNGTGYANSTTVDLLPGNYTIEAPSCAGKRFVGWSVAGNATVQDLSSAVTILDLRGAGAVAAYLAASPAPASPDLLGNVGWFALLAGIVALGVFYLAMRRRRRAGGATAPGTAAPTGRDPPPGR